MLSFVSFRFMRLQGIHLQVLILKLVIGIVSRRSIRAQHHRAALRTFESVASVDMTAAEVSTDFVLVTAHLDSALDADDHIAAPFACLMSVLSTCCIAQSSLSEDIS